MIRTIAYLHWSDVGHGDLRSVVEWWIGGADPSRLRRPRGGYLRKPVASTALSTSAAVNGVSKAPSGVMFAGVGFEQQAGHRGVPGLDREDRERRRDVGRAGDVERLARVGVDAGVLQRDRGLDEGSLVGGGAAEVDFRRADRFAAERLLEEGDVGVLVGGHRLQEDLRLLVLDERFFFWLAVASL